MGLKNIKMNRVSILVLGFFLTVSISCSRETLRYYYCKPGKRYLTTNVKRIYTSDSTFLEKVSLKNAHSKYKFNYTKSIKIINGDWYYLYKGNYLEYLPLDDFINNKVSQVLSEPYGYPTNFYPVGTVEENDKLLYMYRVIAPIEETVSSESRVIYFDRDFGFVKFFEPSLPGNEATEYTHIYK